MNMLLIDPDDDGSEAFRDPSTLAGRARIHGKRAAATRARLAKGAGDRLRVGVLGGPRGEGVIRAIEPTHIDVEITLDPADREEPPLLDLLIAMPRPKQLLRVIHHAVSLGVSRIVIMRTWRVDKSYFESPVLAPVAAGASAYSDSALRAEVKEALEQVGATLAPSIFVEPLFKPFVEDRLPDLLPAGVRGLVAHPAAERALSDVPPIGRAQRVVLAIGPERGFTDYEVQKLAGAGLAPFHLGARILRVETAVPAAMGQIELLRQGPGSASHALS